MSKNTMTALQLARKGAKFIRFTSGDENNTFCGSYWHIDGKVFRCDDRFDHEDVSVVAQAATNTGAVSDGYHTFDELYEHRHLLFAALCNMMPDNCTKTLKNKEGEVWDGWFILAFDHPFLGQVSYHLPMKYWDHCRVREIERNFSYDGHTSEDVLDRLVRF